MRLRQLFENQSTAVMAFGRMNPPTIGHAKLVDAIKSQPGDPYLFLSQSQKPKTDPLAFEDKLRYAKFFFPNITIGNPEVKTVIQALQKIEQLGYKNLIYVAGSDRVASFEELINKYNGKDYNFDSIQVVSAGERDPDADGAEGMSASKMRQAAADNDIEMFKQGVPNKELADELFVAVRAGMGIGESLEEDKAQSSLPDKIEVRKPQNPPKAPDSTIPRNRNGYTTDSGIVYKLDKYNDNIMHVSDGSGTYTFDGARLIKWQTSMVDGLKYTYDYVQRKIKLDYTTTRKTEHGESLIDQSAMYDMQGNKIKGSDNTKFSAGGVSANVGAKGTEIRYSMGSLEIRLKANPRKSQKMDNDALKGLANKLKPLFSGKEIRKAANFANKYADLKLLWNGRAKHPAEIETLMKQSQKDDNES